MSRPVQCVKCGIRFLVGDLDSFCSCGGTLLPVDTSPLPAIRTVLAAYRSTEAHVTEEQITAAWAEYDALVKVRRHAA